MAMRAIHIRLGELAIFLGIRWPIGIILGLLVMIAIMVVMVIGDIDKKYRRIAIGTTFRAMTVVARRIGQ